MISEILFIFHCFPLSSYYFCLWQIKAALQTCRQTWHLLCPISAVASELWGGCFPGRTRSVASVHRLWLCRARPRLLPHPPLPVLLPIHHCTEGKRPDGFWPPLMHFYLWVIILNRKWGLLSWEKVRLKRPKLSSWESGFTEWRQKGRGAKR